jgi:hypothetical protein
MTPVGNQHKENRRLVQSSLGDGSLPRVSEAEARAKNRAARPKTRGAGLVRLARLEAGQPSCPDQVGNNVGVCVAIATARKPQAKTIARIV